MGWTQTQMRPEDDDNDVIGWVNEGRKAPLVPKNCTSCTSCSASKSQNVLFFSAKDAVGTSRRIETAEVKGL